MPHDELLKYDETHIMQKKPGNDFDAYMMSQINRSAKYFKLPFNFDFKNKFVNIYRSNIAIYRFPASGAGLQKIHLVRNMVRTTAR